MYVRTEQEIQWAIRQWRTYHFKYEELDAWVAPFLQINQNSGWLTLIRKANCKSPAQIAARLNCSEDSVRKMEKNENSGAISVKNLRRYAEALDCELVYGIRPKERRPFSQRIIGKILPIALKDKPGKIAYQRINGLVVRMTELMHDPVFRRDHGWCRNPANEGRVIAILLKRMRQMGNNSFRTDSCPIWDRPKP